MTLLQLESLFALYEERAYDKRKWDALLRGVNLDKELAKEKKQEVTMFKDPTEYEKLSKEERKRMTEDMRKLHQRLKL